MERPQQYRFHQGEKTLPFSPDEYDARLSILRKIMSNRGVDACIFTSMHNIAYYSGFLYCSFGRPYGLIVTTDNSITISAGIDAAQPWRRCHGDNITYTDWHRIIFFGVYSVLPVKILSWELKVINFQLRRKAC